ncbi:MAG: hypothetical protein HY066_04380 [Betaproteobacteria bacterium]|nr:hypothetical protein [Betaproteobacteria bacterium]
MLPVDRTHRELTDDDLAKVAGTYHAWRGDNERSEVAAQANMQRTPLPFMQASRS